MELTFIGIRMGKHNASGTVEHGIYVCIYIKFKNMLINILVVYRYRCVVKI